MFAGTHRARQALRVNSAVTKFVYTSPTISPASLRGLSASERIMRLKILVSAVPLLIAAVFARGGLLPGPHPCIAIADTTVQLADLPWHAQLHVSFTRDPAVATVRVQISDSADAADFAVVDDIDTTETDACPVNAATRMVAISASPAASEPVIYLSQHGPADYRIFVRSKTFTPREAAALIVGARGGHRRLAAASL